MVYAIAAKSGQRPRWHQLEHAIRRNFGGLTERTPVDMFKRYFQDADVSTAFLKRTNWKTSDIFFSCLQFSIKPTMGILHLFSY